MGTRPGARCAGEIRNTNFETSVVSMRNTIELYYCIRTLEFYIIIYKKLLNLVIFLMRLQ
jgi:hypothetical protein